MWIKDPSDDLFYQFDFAQLENGTGDSNWLDRTSSPLESISTFTISIDSPGLTIESSAKTHNNTVVTIRVSGGTGGTKYPITCKIVTTTSETKEITEIMAVMNR